MQSPKLRRIRKANDNFSIGAGEGPRVSMGPKMSTSHLCDASGHPSNIGGAGHFAASGFAIDECGNAFIEGQVCTDLRVVLRLE